ncbi:MAG: hypothetical protein WAU96_16465 [Anaerolineae bacterium]
MKGFLSVIVFIALVAFALGASVSGAALVAVSPKPSQEVVNAIAVAEAKAKEDREKEASARTTAIVNSLITGFVIFVLIGGAGGGAVVASKWIKRHDRMPDEAGRYPLVPADISLANPNLTGPYLAERIETPAMLQLAGMRAQVDMTAMAFRGGIQGRQASDRQRDLRPDPPGWDGTITMPQEEQPIGLDGFMLVDEKGNQQQLSAGRKPEFAGAPTTENTTWQ